MYVDLVKENKSNDWSGLWVRIGVYVQFYDTDAYQCPSLSLRLIQCFSINHIDWTLYSGNFRSIMIHTAVIDPPIL